MAKRILVLDDVRTFQPCEGLELLHTRTVREAITALETQSNWDEIWLDYHLEWNHPKPYDEPFHSGARLAMYLARHDKEYGLIVVRVISDLGAHYIEKITDHLEHGDYTYTLNPDGEGLPTSHTRSYS